MDGVVAVPAARERLARRLLAAAEAEQPQRVADHAVRGEPYRRWMHRLAMTNPPLHAATCCERSTSVVGTPGRAAT